MRCAWQATACSGAHGGRYYKRKQRRRVRLTARAAARGRQRFVISFHRRVDIDMCVRRGIAASSFKGGVGRNINNVTNK